MEKKDQKMHQTTQLCSLLTKDNRLEDLNRALADEAFFQELLLKYNLNDV